MAYILYVGISLCEPSLLEAANTLRTFSRWVPCDSAESDTMKSEVLGLSTGVGAEFSDVTSGWTLAELRLKHEEWREGGLLFWLSSTWLELSSPAELWDDDSCITKYLHYWHSKTNHSCVRMSFTGSIKIDSIHFVVWLFLWRSHDNTQWRIRVLDTSLTLYLQQDMANVQPRPSPKNQGGILSLIVRLI